MDVVPDGPLAQVAADTTESGESGLDTMSNSDNYIR